MSGTVSVAWLEGPTQSTQLGRLYPTSQSWCATFRPVKLVLRQQRRTNPASALVTQGDGFRDTSIRQTAYRQLSSVGRVGSSVRARGKRSFSDSALLFTVYRRGFRVWAMLDEGEGEGDTNQASGKCAACLSERVYPDSMASSSDPRPEREISSYSVGGFQ
ncbi:hypothetical protein, variant [Phialophora macrospora]|uniref:Uncharacterized protein n=1 Tax=Phialophora macrospora TaxID=1851006 RepID=A0A0D2CW87_9EURO|nr:hypothetical protein PV04_05294 [Phialophora macrospora]KIW69416.1 hypothetical protein, variant [Phialophora macrospora]